MDEKTQNPLEPEDSQWLKDLFDSAESSPSPSDDQALPSLEADDDQWLQELLKNVEAQSEQELAPEAAASVEAPASDLDEAWLQELFTSTEQAAEQSFSPEAPEKQEPTEDLWPESLSEPMEQGVQIEADEEALSDAGLVRPKEVESAPVKDSEEPQEEDTEEENDPDEENPDADEDESEEAKKRRPKNKNGYGLLGIPHILVTAVWLAIILFLGVFFGQWLWNGAKDVLAFGREDRAVIITIEEDETLDSLTEKLHTAGLINEPIWFRWYGQLTGVMEDVGVGAFKLNTLYDYRALVRHMSPNSSARITVKVVIPEGYTCQQIFALMERQNVCSAAALEDAAVNGALTEYWFLKGVERTDKYCLEGYLYPDTYEFYVGDSATRVLNTMLSNFNKRFTDIMLAKLDVLNAKLGDQMWANGLSEEYIAQHTYTIREVVIIASMIEKETSGATEGYTISSVIYNRLTNPGAFPYLNIDAALVYITGNHNLTAEDKRFDSPYNTYLYPGLIPGPICNPSRASLDAALDPANTDYYYYALNPATGTHHFSATYAEHQAFLDSLTQAQEETP